MELYGRLRSYTVKQTVKQIMKLLPRISDETLIKLTYLAEKLTSLEEVKEKIRTVRNAFEEGHPGLSLAKRLTSSLSPNVIEKLAQSLFINQFFLGATRRKEIQDEEGFTPPFLLVISPTMRCNLRCPGCYAAEYSKDDDLPFDLIDKVLVEAKELGIYFVTISGGEPFIRDDLLDLYAKHNDMYFQVYTNGQFIDKELARKLYKLGNIAPCISLEGFEKETDLRRGPGTFARISQAMDNLRDVGVPIGVSITVNRDNWQVVYSDELIDMLIDKGVLFGWYFQYVPLGRNASTELMCTPEQRNYLRARIYQIRNTKSIFMADFWNDGIPVDGCIAGGRLYCHINVRGDVEPCVFAQFAVDNIRDNSLKDALNSPFFRAIREAQKHMKNKLRPCMIIDRPGVLRTLVRKYQAHATNEGAQRVVTEFAHDLNRYSARLREITEPVWQEFTCTGDWSLLEREHVNAANHG